MKKAKHYNPTSTYGKILEEVRRQDYDHVADYFKYNTIFEFNREIKSKII